MEASKVGGVRLKQAVSEFGSLQNAINTLEMKKRKLEDELSALTKEINTKQKTSASLDDEIKKQENIILQSRQEIKNLEGALRKCKQSYEEFIETKKQFLLQYSIVESFMAMLHTSPSVKESIKELATNISILGDVVWKFSDEPNKLRKVFIQIVLGDHLHCYYCEKCGLRFIANKQPESHILGYRCPDCGFLSSLKADDSFLKAMLESSNAVDTSKLDEPQR